MLKLTYRIVHLIINVTNKQVCMCKGPSLANDYNPAHPKKWPIIFYIFATFRNGSPQMNK